MAEQVEIEVVTKTDLSEVEELNDLVERIKETAGEETTINLYMEDLKSELEDATSDVEKLQEELLNMEVGDPDFGDVVSQLEEAQGRAEDLSNELESLNDIVVAPEVDTSGLENAQEDLEETEVSVGGVKTALVGLVATAEIEHMATVADNINTSWNRLKLTFENTGVSMDTLKQKVSEVSAETSRSGGVIRDYFNQMGVAGVTNVDLLASSFESLSGKAYQLDTSVENLEGKLQTMVLTGTASTKMLKSLGLTAEDLAAVMNVTADEVADAFANMTPEQRLQTIAQAMGDGAAANQMYGDSYEAMKQKADMAMSGLEGAIGQAILPTVIPAIDASTDAVKALTDGFKNLPAPVQNAIGTTMGVAAIATTGIGMFGEFAGAIANLGDAYGVLKGVYQALIPVEEAEGVAGWFSIGWIAAAILLGIALGLAFIYLYENCDWFREAVDNLAQTLQWLVNLISSAVMGTLQWLSNEFQAFTSQLGLNTNNWIEAILGFILFLPQLPMKLAEVLLNAIAQALGFKGNFTQTLRDTATNAANAFRDAIMAIPRALQECLNWAYNVVMSSPLVQALQWLGQQAAWAFSVLGLGQSSPGKIVKSMRQELDWTSEAIQHSKLATDTKNLGASMASSFNPSLIGGSGGSGGSIPAGFFAGDTVINVYGDVDSDKRVQEIVDAVRRELNWDNKTAGRTV